MSDAATGGSGLVQPPRLRDEESGEASRLELFFDLAYVLVVLQLAQNFYTDLTWHGLVVLVGLFTAIWFSWIRFTLYANRFDTDDVVFRLAKLAATGAIAGCAAAASAAVGKYAVYFAASFLLGRLILLLLYVRAWRHVPQGQPTIAVYLSALGVSSAFWAASLVVPEPGRYWLWAAAVLPDVVAPLVATARKDKLPLHVEHLPGRFGLFIIWSWARPSGVRSAGSTTPAGPPVPDRRGPGPGAGLQPVVDLLRDVAATSSTGRLADNATENADAVEGSGSSDRRHDAFVYGHLPIAFGAVLVGVALEDLAVHLNTEADWLLAAGLALFLLGIALIVGGTTRSWRSVWPWPVAFVPLLPLVPYPAAVDVAATYAVLQIVLAVHGIPGQPDTEHAAQRLSAAQGLPAPTTAARTRAWQGVGHQPSGYRAEGVELSSRVGYTSDKTDRPT